MQLSELAALVRGRPGPVRLVAVDGPGGAGKSTFAALLAEELGGAPVVHTDDFASWDDPIDWWPRMLQQVIEPLARGARASYQRYDWGSGSLAEWIDVEPEPVVILDGVTAGRSEWRHHLAVIVWVETPPAERLRRGLGSQRRGRFAPFHSAGSHAIIWSQSASRRTLLARDGVDALDDWEAWGAAEDRHYGRDPTRRHADVVVDGTVAVVDGEFATTAPPPR